ncbi:MAG: hypothetical protein JSU87_17510 [Gemmatimonadota bacterium]|nr:MAG: hypothetical protein JSU87_17510 [Gemmatimonadota bacterium]
MRVGTNHLEMDELLALRDGEGGASARAHVEACEGCQQELERLYQVRAQLRALSGFAPPRGLWPRVARHVRRRRRLRRRLGYGAVGLAAAAALAGVYVVNDATRGPPAEPLEAWVIEAESQDLGPMISRSRELESLLQTYRPASQVYDAPTALAVSVLEDRILLLDRLLSDSRQLGVKRELLRDLWGERVETLETLVNLELAEPETVWR